MYMRYQVFILLAISLLLGCDPEILNESEVPIPSRLYVWVNIPRDQGTHGSTRIRFVDGAQGTTISPEEYATNVAGALSAGPYPLRPEGRLAVSVELLDAGNRSVSIAQSWLDLAPEWRWDVFVAVGSTNPLLTCYGCQGGESFALDSSLGFPAGDSLYMYWAGNYLRSIPRPAY